MMDFFESKNISAEARISIVLNTFMYIDAKGLDLECEPTLKEVVDIIMKDYGSLNGSQTAALLTVNDYFARPENADIAALRMVNNSYDMGDEYLGAYASAFRKNDNSEVYVVYRGTGKGRWYDNGDAFARIASQNQKDAVEYFEETMRRLRIQNGTKLIVTGHSKGGNLAQYVTMTSLHRGNINKCISFDGQGFSPEFIKDEKKQRNDYEIQRQKMYSICGYNDYVNVLGIKVIPEENTQYIMTGDTPASSFFNAHTIVPDSNVDYPSYTNTFLFNYYSNSFNRQVEKQGFLALFAKNLSSLLINENVEPAVRASVCHVFMSLMENTEGLYGEKSEKKDREILLNEFSFVLKDALRAAAISAAQADINSIYNKMKNWCQEETAFQSAVGDAESNELSNKELEKSALINGKTGDDKLTGGDKKDYIYGGHGNDEIHGRFGDDELFGEYGDDTIYGDGGSDFISGGAGNDRLYGNSNDDTINGDEGDDYIEGGLGKDIIDGGSGNDTIYGDLPNSDNGDADIIRGGGGNDVIYGGDGSDVIDGGRGNNILYGGGGDDVYIFNNEINRNSDDRDTVYDAIGWNSVLFKGVPSDINEFRTLIRFEKSEDEADLIIIAKNTNASMTISNYYKDKLNYSFMIDGNSECYSINDDMTLVEANTETIDNQLIIKFSSTGVFSVDA